MDIAFLFHEAVKGTVAWIGHANLLIEVHLKLRP